MSQLEMLSPDTREFFERPKGLLINNEWLNPLSGQYFDDVNPSTKSVHAQVARATEADVERAAKAARDAFYNSHWHNMAPNDRGRYLWKLADLMEIHQQELAELDSLDMGMPIRASRYGTVPLAIDHVRYMAGWATKITGESIGVSAGNYLNYTLKEPVGVVGAIIPWNFPLLMAVWKISAALAAGCTVVLKPAEQSPLSAIRLGELIIEAGFPAGVVNIVTGLGHEAGAALSRSPWVNKIAFTGSTAVGQTIMREAAHNMTRVSLELGGKSPNIIFEDASLRQAVSGALMGIFMNQGEVCAAGSRIFVQRSIYEQVLNALIEQSSKLKVGDALDPSTRMGPVVSEEQFVKIQGYIEGAKSQGGKIVVGGSTANQQGFFINPTIIRDVTDDMTVAQEEIFGPVAAVMAFDTVDEVIERANRSWYGLAAGVWTENIRTAHYVAHALEVGTVWVNSYHVYDAAAPWGGRKMSGFGREMGKEALDLYTETKDVWINLDR